MVMTVLMMVTATMLTTGLGQHACDNPKSTARFRRQYPSLANLHECMQASSDQLEEATCQIEAPAVAKEAAVGIELFSRSAFAPARRSKPSSEILSPRRRETLMHNASLELGRSVLEAHAWSIGTDDRHCCRDHDARDCGHCDADDDDDDYDHNVCNLCWVSWCYRGCWCCSCACCCCF